MTFKQAIDENRYAQFRIGYDSFKRDPDTIARLLAKVLIVKCEYLHSCHAFSYEAVSPLFEKKDPSLFPPKLDVYMNNDGDLDFLRNHEDH